MKGITALVLTLNEEKNIEECLQTLLWADKLIVLDSGSSDRTVEIAWRMGAEVFFHPFQNYADQRNFALQLVQTDWVLFIDADERVTPELAQEIREAVEKESICGWWIPRKNYICGRWVRHGGWYPDYQLRLLRPEKAHYDSAWEVHEIVVVEGGTGYLRHHIIHYNYRTWPEFIARQKVYLPLEVRTLRKRGIKAKPWSPFSMPLREFWRRYFKLEGYKDGLYGLILALAMAFYTMLAYTQLFLSSFRLKEPRA
ncbi:MAG: glycosyltransferase family 2 protein [Anaerolineae bacterium]|nr:glycosyltransferase family 2 protein [Anaerolineae bacterium]MDW8101307.1 glycosyltransferase family 2 protein [Anaerolineae bacterium]